GSLDDVGITVEDDHTLVVELEQPTEYFLELTAFYTYYPVNEEVASENEDWAVDAGDDYVSNGPFELASWDHKDNIVIEESDDDWDAYSVRVGTTTMPIVDDEHSALLMYGSDD